MSRTSKTTELLKEFMADALLVLMRSKPFEKITVQDITDNAGVGRATWFRHFTTKNEALTYKLMRLWGRWATDHNLSSIKRYSIEHAETFFYFCYDIRDTMRLIFSAQLQSVIYEAFYNIMKRQYDGTPSESYKSRFYSYGLFGLLDEWIKRDYAETPAEMTKIYMKTLSSTYQE